MAVNASDWDAQVLTVRVVCHTAGRVGASNASDNHWSLYFLLGGGKSVRFNMRADPGYIDGTLDIHSYNYELSISAIRYWDYPAVKYFTVRMAYEYLVVRCQYHQYNMSGGGSGCRWWMLACPANENLTMLINTVSPLSPLWPAQGGSELMLRQSFGLTFSSNTLLVRIVHHLKWFAGSFTDARVIEQGSDDATGHNIGREISLRTRSLAGGMLRPERDKTVLPKSALERL